MVFDWKLIPSSEFSMALDRNYQPITLDTKNLVVGCYNADVTDDIGIEPPLAFGTFKEGTFSVDTRQLEVSGGYPIAVKEIRVDQIGVSASIVIEEFNEYVKLFLKDMLGALWASSVLQRSLSLYILRPNNAKLKVKLFSAAVLPQFELTFANDFNSLRLDFEQLVEVGEEIADRVKFIDDGPITSRANSQLLSANDLAIGLPKVSIGEDSMGAVQSVSLRLVTEFNRYYANYPRTLRLLTPLKYDIFVDIEYEEVTADNQTVDLLGTYTDPAEEPLFGTAVKVLESCELKIEVPKCSGGTIAFTLPYAVRLPTSGIDLNTDWGASKITFKATHPPGEGLLPPLLIT